MWMSKEKAYLSERLMCAALIEISPSAPLECEAILMTLLPILRLIHSLEISISGAMSNDTLEGRGSGTLSKNERSMND